MARKKKAEGKNGRRKKAEGKNIKNNNMKSNFSTTANIFVRNIFLIRIFIRLENLVMVFEATSVYRTPLDLFSRLFFPDTNKNVCVTKIVKHHCSSVWEKDVCQIYLKHTTDLIVN